MYKIYQTAKHKKHTPDDYLESADTRQQILPKIFRNLDFLRDNEQLVIVQTTAKKVRK